MEARHLIALACCLSCFASMAAAVPGTATFYTPPYVPSACYGFENKGVMIAAASVSLRYTRGPPCGKRYRLTCTGGTNASVAQPCRGSSVVVTIVDFCPARCQGTIDLSQEAFKTIADPNAGVININYQQV